MDGIRPGYRLSIRLLIMLWSLRQVSRVRKATEDIYSGKEELELSLREPDVLRRESDGLQK